MAHNQNSNMEQHITNAGDAPENNSNNSPSDDGVKFRSPDRLVEVVVKGVGQAKRYPDHAYQVVCLRLHPQAGTRVQKTEGGGLDVLFTHVEVAALLTALNSVDGKAQYKWTEIPEKPASRKAFWAQVNAQRRAEQLGLKKAA
jgi:hypothetical protein